MNCLGCRIVKQLEPEVHKIYENEHLVCVLDIAPFNEGHILILPKEHVHDVEDMNPATLEQIMKASVHMSQMLKRLYKPDGITMCQNGGVFNDLTHYHLHVIPRFKGDGFAWTDPVLKHGAEDRLTETKARIVKELFNYSE